MNLLAARTQIVGRDDDVRLIRTLLADRRLVTLIGPGGVGKTALAVAVAGEVETEFARVIKVSVAHAEDRGELVCLLSGAVLGEPVEDLLRTAAALSATPTLVVVDNCEQVAGEAADVLYELIATTTDEVRVLATSRRPLEVGSEATVVVRPLPFPTDLGPTPITEFAAVQLYLERVREADPAFELTDDNQATVAAICAAADGVPLVLELAASLVRVRSLADILAVVTDRPAVLGSGRRDLHDHQRGVEASLEWSRRFLSAEDERLLNRLSVFAGGFTVDAARRVAPDADDLAVTRLVDHSLVSFEPGTGRYRLLELIRVDAEARVEPEERRGLEARHFDWCRELAVEIGIRLSQPDPEHTFPLYNLEIPNLGTALKRAWQAGDLARCRTLVAPMASWWVHHARPDGVAQWEELLDDGAGEGEAAQIETALAYHWSHRGDHARSLEYARRALGRAHGAGETMTEAGARFAAGNARAALGDREGALADYADGLARAVESGDGYSELLARVLLARLDPDRASIHLTGALTIARRGYTVMTSMVLVELAREALGAGRMHDARGLVEEAVEISRGVDFAEGLGTALIAEADVVAAVGESERARAGYNEALAVGSRISHEGVMAPARAGLAALPRADPSPGPDRRASIGSVEDLTDRERAVARLLRGDLTQREIAEELYVAPSTVKTHIKSIYRKLGVAKRSHAVTRAAELGLFDR